MKNLIKHKIKDYVKKGRRYFIYNMKVGMCSPFAYGNYRRLYSYKFLHFGLMKQYMMRVKSSVIIKLVDN